MALEVIRDSSTAAPPEDAFDRTFNRMLDNFFQGNPRFCASERVWNPPTDVFESCDAIHIKMEVAGVKEEHLEVKVVDNLLIIRGRRSDEQHTKRENYHLMEIHYGSFERVFGLPTPMEVKSVKAMLEDGFLLVTIPKDERLREYRIEIE